MFEGLITSKMRVRILMRLFLNPESRAYLRELTSEFEASPGHVRNELRQLSEAGLLCAEQRGRQINYYANINHPLFPELHSMVRKSLGMDRIIESIVERLGHLEKAYLTGDCIRNEGSGAIDLVLVGNINCRNLDDLVSKTERYISRQIRTRVVSSSEFDSLVASGELHPGFLLWQNDERGLL